MGLKMHLELVKDAAAYNQTRHGQPRNKLLKINACRQMKELVADVVERQVEGGALNHLRTQELELLTSRIDDLSSDDFKLVDAIVEALVPRPTGQKINLEDEGINIPEDKQ